MQTNKSQSHLDLDFIDSNLLSSDNWRILPTKSDGCNIYQLNFDLYNHIDVKQTNRDLIYLRMSDVWSENSYCERMKVGCLIVKDRSIISDGYNGTPKGFPNVCESDPETTLRSVLHAEANAITKLAKGTQSSVDSTLYVTLSPCYECSKLIIQSEIRRVVFSEVYRKPESIAFLLEAGIEIVKLKIK
jgi:dCMP deaminase